MKIIRFLMLRHDRKNPSKHRKIRAALMKNRTLYFIASHSSNLKNEEKGESTNKISGKTRKKKIQFSESFFMNCLYFKRSRKSVKFSNIKFYWIIFYQSVHDPHIFSVYEHLCCTVELEILQAVLGVCNKMFMGFKGGFLWKFKGGNLTNFLAGILKVALNTQSLKNQPIEFSITTQQSASKISSKIFHSNKNFL